MSAAGASVDLMCGRYATTRSAGELSAIFDALDETGERVPVDYNVAPTNPVPIVRVDPEPGRRVLSLARWGFLPPWAEDPRIGSRMINARAETVATSRVFAPAFARRRCLVPADGWYEWVRSPGAGRGRSQAYFMTPRSGEVLAFAGLWSLWRDGARSLVTCTVVTTAARGALAEIHDRMPLVLPPHRWEGWLADRAEATEIVATVDEPFLAGLEIRPVGPAVGDVRNNGPDLITRVAPQDGPEQTTLF